MKTLTIWQPGGDFTNIDADATIGMNDYLITMTERKGWRVIKPIPHRKLVTSLTGQVYFVPPPPGFVHYDHFLLNINAHKHCLALGRNPAINIPANTEWANAYLLDLKTVKSLGNQGSSTRVLNYDAMKPVGLWSCKTTPEVSNFWIGPYFGFSGSAWAMRGSFFLGLVWKLGNFEKKYLVAGWGGYAALGAGASGGGGIMLLPGYKNIDEMKNRVSFEVDFSLDAGPSWKNLAKSATKYGPALSRLNFYANAYESVNKTLKQFEQQKKIFDEVKKLKDLSNKWTALLEKGKEIYWSLGKDKGFVDALKRMNDVELAKTLLTCAGFDGTKPGLDFIDIAAGGAQLSVFAGYKKLESISKFG